MAHGAHSHTRCATWVSAFAIPWLPRQIRAISVGTNACEAAAHTPCERHILGHHCHPLGMHCAKLGVLEQVHEHILCSLLQGGQGLLGPAHRLQSKVLCYLTHKPLKGKDGDEELGVAL